jgi:hypothetical protein
MCVAGACLLHTAGAAALAPVPSVQACSRRTARFSRSASPSLCPTCVCDKRCGRARTRLLHISSAIAARGLVARRGCSSPALARLARMAARSPHTGVFRPSMHHPSVPRYTPSGRGAFRGEPHRLHPPRRRGWRQRHSVSGDRHTADGQWYYCPSAADASCCARLSASSHGIRSPPRPGPQPPSCLRPRPLSRRALPR